MGLAFFRASQPAYGFNSLVLDEIEKKDEKKEAILCRFCHCSVTDTENQIIVNGSHCHVFANPHGYVFEIGCYKRATGCLTLSEPSVEFSWFSGYQWQIAICRACSNHLGWYFLSKESSFFGLIQKNLIIY